MKFTVEQSKIIVRALEEEASRTRDQLDQDMAIYRYAGAASGENLGRTHKIADELKEILVIERAIFSELEDAEQKDVFIRGVDTDLKELNEFREELDSYIS